MARRPRRPELERLEDRCTPATFGVPWPGADGLTLSFPPDGTSVAGVPNSLSASLGSGSGLATTDWEFQILKAFQTWAVNAGINIGLTTDDGAAFGATGPVQGGSGRGDIRIGDRPLGPDAVSMAVPYDAYDGWAGDLLLDSNQTFSIGGGSGQSGSYDLYSIALHEAGHVFGFPGDADPASVMYETYLGPRAGLSPGDIANLQDLYGSRGPDRFELGGGNDTFDQATQIKFLSSVDQLTGRDGTLGARPFVVRADLSSPSDVDIYRVRTPADATSFTVTLRASGLSLLTSRVSVYDASGQLVATASTTDPTSNDVTIPIANAQPNAQYYVKVQGARGDVFDVGRYRLAVGLASSDALFPSPTFPVRYNDHHSDDTFDTATSLGTVALSADGTWTSATLAGIYNAGDVDVYQLHTAAQSSGALVASVWALEANRLDPTVSVYDANHNLVAAQLLNDDRGADTIQIQNVAPNQDYYVMVASSKPHGASATGNYSLTVNVLPGAIAVDSLASGALSQSQPQDFRTFSVGQTQLFSFDLALANPTTTKTAGRLTIYDSTQTAVFTMNATDAQDGQGSVILQPGVYTMRFVAATKNNKPLPNLTYLLRGFGRSDPIGPQPTDPTTQPTDPPPPPPPAPPALPPGVTSQVTQAPTTSSNLYPVAQADPYSDPWTSI